MTERCPSTFNPYTSYNDEQGDVIKIPKEELEGNYQSTYLTMYNYITSKGWCREDKRWKSPHYPDSFYQNILKAYEAQRVWEIANSEDS